MSGELNQPGSIVMTGENKAKNYLAMQKIVGGVYLNKFYQVMSTKKCTGRFLEIGSGPGYQTVEVMRKFQPNEIVVVEPSRDMVNAAVAYINERGLKDAITFNLGFVEDEKLIQSLGKFNLVYSTLSLHHWADPVRGFRNLNQALEQNGLIIIHDFQRINMPFHFTFHQDENGSRHKTYTADEIGLMLDKAGISNFKLISCFPFQVIIITRSNNEKIIPVHHMMETLDDLKPGQEGAIAEIRSDEERKRELESVGVHRTAHIKIIETDPQHVVFGLEHKKFVVDRETASGIAIQVFNKRSE